MKKIFKSIIVLLIVLLSCPAFAQFQNNRMGSGVNRNMGTDSRYNAPEKREPVDHVKIMTDNMTTQLNLDAFQSAIVKNIIQDFTKTMTDISMLNIPNTAKTEKSNLARTSMESKFMEILNENQKKIFERLLKESSNKEKKNKKKQKNESVSEE